MTLFLSLSWQMVPTKKTCRLVEQFLKFKTKTIRGEETVPKVGRPFQ